LTLDRDVVIDESVETVLEFVRRINQRDADKLAELMTEDHVFIDSLARPCAREKMRDGLCMTSWRNPRTRHHDDGAHDKRQPIDTP